MENESTLKCKKYGLTEVCGNLEEYEDRLEKERNAESEFCFFLLPVPSHFSCTLDEPLYIVGV